jgi:hypothetical protein
MYYVLCTMYGVCYVLCVLCAVCCVLCNVYCVLCTAYCVLCAVYYVLCTMHLSNYAPKHLCTYALMHLCTSHLISLPDLDMKVAEKAYQLTTAMQKNEDYQTLLHKDDFRFVDSNNELKQWERRYTVF